jgi:DNA (cytosine-5)-methyltransferase 1
VTIGSLFSGIGGLELGIERATGARTIWQVEIDPYCRAVLAKHWPDARRYEDVRTIGAEVERPDIICGGFPCQNLSSSASMHGGRTGLHGEASGLWHEYARAVRVLRPRFVFVENVPDLVDLGLDEVLGALAALGYDAEWGVFSHLEVGGWTNRERLFLLAHTLRVRDTRLIEGADSGVDGRWVPRGAAIVPGWFTGWMAHARGDREPVALLRGTDARVPHRVDRIRALGNAVVPQVAEKAWKVLYERSMKP